jgi:hypothetical protein
VEPRRRVLEPDLERWLVSDGRGLERAGDHEAGDQEDERRTAVVRISASADTAAAAERLREVGATVQTAGAATVTVAVTRDELQRLLDEPWIVAIEAPRRLFPRSGPGLPSPPDR